MLMLAMVAVAERTAVTSLSEDDQDSDFLWRPGVAFVGDDGLCSKSSRAKRCSVGLVCMAFGCLRLRNVLSHRSGPDFLGDSGSTSSAASGSGSCNVSAIGASDELRMTLEGCSSSSTKLRSSPPFSTTSSSVSATPSSLASSWSLVTIKSDLRRELRTDAKLARLENPLLEALRRSEPVGKRRSVRLCEEEDLDAVLWSSWRRKAGATSDVRDDSELPEERLRSRWC